jgi:protein-S-isoprenylcysteine O-methyltransferase Ste14
MSPVYIILATVVYAALHSGLATLGIKARTRKMFGPNTDRWYRLAYNLFGGVSFLPILVLLAVLPDKVLYRVSMPWLVFTSFGQLLGVTIIVVGIWQADAWTFLGVRQISGNEDLSENQALIVHGLYKWVRHPLYTGGLLLIWFTPVMSVNLLTLFVCLTIYLVIGARFEEGRLIHEFGQEYEKYQRRVPMLIPKVPRKKRS